MAARWAVFASVVIWMVLAARGQWEESKIIGGTAVSINKSPFLAALEKRDTSSAPFLQNCGCVIIDRLYIISAAHCFAELADDLTISYPAASLFRIRAGSSLLERGGTLHSVAKYWVHPKFKGIKGTQGTALDYDIAVARLKTPIVFGKTVAKANLIGMGQHLKKGTKVITAGWGVTQVNGQNAAPSALLRRAVFSIVEQPECDRQYLKQANARVSQRCICTYAASKGNCLGDSGGAVYNRTGNVVVGIVSWGACVQVPNVVTDLGNVEIRNFIRNQSKLKV
ncbi:mite allergen Der p 3-like isoform X1 [Thrips palmi]|uniref:Mite allergen Der p 3-like isoform X1 n=1 Tax=Thrips palmi TaxID=161013 RepID=A0A6P9A7D8_THRPL|nr:mite allergen Der p 3-like isoform X1 [Thrips palmi]